MRTSRIAVTASVLGALALPLVTASAAHAALPTATPGSTSGYCTGPGPWAVHGTSAVKIRSHPSSKSTARGVLHKSHSFKAKKKSGGWVYVINKTTGIKGWASGKYVYRAAGMCLD
ncbi:SH3 domain-containing protein [Streptomyces sp. LHD-70]|uniref:SH3 domain-containing protein n=1 Tax=Streptomyces sp. LHD-70 TaxID=3072140 RepID=UPI0028105C55|nr:SH3 domain-containing protein [Streptomyces sp. LHD-70]MDQ8704090.1 SH3 domain-containing protein [Streptomyces sp. LHD-70]